MAGCFVAIVIFALIALVVGAVLMVAWNAVMPALFGLPELTLFQSIALVFVVNILLGALKTVVTSK